MTQQETPARPARPPRVMRAATVKSAERLTPHLVRITFEGPALAGFDWHGPAEHLRIFFPQAGQQRPVMPELDENGRPRDGQPRPTSRVYTPRAFDPEANVLTVDIVLHDDAEGPGATWASNAKPGDEVLISGPSGPYNVDLEADWYVVAGDHAGLPGVATVLESLPAGAKAHVYVEVPDAGDEIALQSPATLSTVWLHAGHEVPGRGLAQALRAAELPEGNGRIFVACEAASMRGIRRHLLHERGLPREAIHTHGYWQYGEANHPDHDLGQDVE